MLRIMSSYVRYEFITSLYLYVCIIVIEFYPICSWLDPLIWAGYKRELIYDDLYAIPGEYKSQHLLENLNKSVTFSTCASTLLQTCV